MALVELNWNPTDRQLRQFGGISVVALPLLGVLWKASLPTIGVLVGFGAMLAVLAWFLPQAVKPIFIGISVAAIPIGIVAGEIVLLSVFLLVFLPMGLIFKIISRDSLRLQKPQTDSYWQTKAQPRNAASYFRQS